LSRGEAQGSEEIWNQLVRVASSEQRFDDVPIATFQER
jgi:hypothetical protein